MAKNASEQWSLKSEFSDADLGDERRRKRLVDIAGRMQSDPKAGFPTMMGSEAATEGLYRFLNNPGFSEYDVLEPHIRQTEQRAKQSERVLAIHDQTPFVFDFQDQQEAVGPLNTSEQGFYGQISLAVAGDGRRRPIGVPAFSTIFRTEDSEESSPDRRLSGADYANKEQRESDWWMRHARWTQGVFAESSAEVIHVGDAEFDSYERLAQLEHLDYQYVTRARRRKVTVCETGKYQWIGEAAEQIEPVIEKRIDLSRRQPSSAPRRRAKYPDRPARQADICMGTQQVRLHKPNYLPDQMSGTLEVTMVRVWEPNPPDGEDPVEWVLLTNQPFDNTTQSRADYIQQVVDDYRARWRIESYFKALKTGCSYRKRQLENRGSLLKALALSVPMAWLLMAMRDWGRQQTDQPAKWYFTEETLEVLRHFADRAVPESPTLHEATFAIAGLGGHLQSNGPPGWQILQRGLTKLERYTEGWQAALQKSDP